MTDPSSTFLYSKSVPQENFPIFSFISGFGPLALWTGLWAPLLGASCDVQSDCPAVWWLWDWSKPTPYNELKIRLDGGHACVLYDGGSGDFHNGPCHDRLHFVCEISCDLGKWFVAGLGTKFALKHVGMFGISQQC